PQAVEVAATEKPLGLIGAAGLQVINPKTWMMAVAVVSVFAGHGAERQGQVVLLSLVFFLVSMPCLGTWALLGVGSARVFRSARAMQRFNRGMAVLLLVATWLSVVV
ncbi:MAG TPA: lysine transporter LysE, partial [Pseudomonas sp.]|nr:lysine transporter LysE [Pseudomonas sp.]